MALLHYEDAKNGQKHGNGMNAVKLSCNKPFTPMETHAISDPAGPNQDNTFG